MPDLRSLGLSWEHARIAGGLLMLVICLWAFWRARQDDPWRDG